ncbi:MAG TPA: patatin-like phospholipase family protein [Alphaproteobacteria bacterium]|nr:patatin-like phospholipase family protein [Alphaproteobacteria bacterium]HQS93713.1 patatin-like phospholipase family protein [Alphaproteobacteria bacterium]
MKNKSLIFFLLILGSFSLISHKFCTASPLKIFMREMSERSLISSLYNTKRYLSSTDLNPPKKVVRILSIDGGGIRGILPALVLCKLESEIERKSGQKKRIGEVFDIIAGTSTGGIMALGLSMKGNDHRPCYSAFEIKNLYEKNGQRIFEGFGFVRKVSTIYGLLAPKYSTEGFKRVLKSYFEDTRLSQACTTTLVTSHNLEPGRNARHGDILFNSREAYQNQSNDYLMRHVARATGSAPTYFESAKIKSIDSVRTLNLIDGGIFCNNPTKIALKTARRYWPGTDYDYVIVSLGTGYSDEAVIDYYNSRAGGILSWGKTFPSLMLQNASAQVDDNMSHLYPQTGKERRYFRIQFILPKCNIALDNASSSNIRKLEIQGNSQLSDRYSSYVDRISDILVQERPYASNGILIPN